MNDVRAAVSRKSRVSRRLDRVCTRIVPATPLAASSGRRSSGVETAADRLQRAREPWVVGARRIPEMMMRVDDAGRAGHHGRVQPPATFRAPAAGPRGGVANAPHQPHPPRDPAGPGRRRPRIHGAHLRRQLPARNRTVRGCPARLPQPRRRGASRSRRSWRRCSRVLPVETCRADGSGGRHVPHRRPTRPSRHCCRRTRPSTTSNASTSTPPPGWITWPW